MAKRNNKHSVEDITSISVKYKASHLEFYTKDGCRYYTQVGISCSSGVRSITLVKYYKDENRLNSEVSFQEKQLLPLYAKCRKSMTKKNKLELAARALELFNEFYGNICMDDFPQGTDPALSEEKKTKHNPTAGLWDYLPDVKIGKRTIKKNQIKKWLGSK